MLLTRESMENKLHQILEVLPMDKLNQLVDFAEYLKSREEWDATLELLADPVMRQDVEQGRQQANKGEGRNWREARPHAQS